MFVSALSWETWKRLDIFECINDIKYEQVPSTPFSWRSLVKISFPYLSQLCSSVLSWLRDDAGLLCKLPVAAAFVAGLSIALES